MQVLGALVALLVCCAVVTAAPPKWHELKGYTFEQYTADFRKFYEPRSSEYGRRKALFERKLEEIQRHNAKGHSTYHLGVNQFTDRTKDEIKSMTPRMYFNPSEQRKHQQLYERTSLKANANRHHQVDWRSVTPPVLSAIKDQGYCGSCWAFGTTETLESHWAIATGNLFELAPQQLVSCVPPKVIPPASAMSGCNGYFPNDAMDYLVGAGGLTEEHIYPYTSYFADNVTQNGTWGACNWRSKFAITPVTGYVQIPNNDQASTIDAVTNEGPLTTIMYVMNDFMSYEGGIYDNPQCISDEMEPSHVVQIVGYGHDDDLKVDYWLLRNSWSPLWGEAGFFRMLKTSPAQCGVMQSWPIPGPSWGNTTSCGMCGILTSVIYPVVSP